MSELTATGVLGNAVIIFTSDNGFFHGEHRIPSDKDKVYEESVRVPLLIRGGGFPAGAKPTQLAANIDLAPTLVALAGATARRVMDGRSLLPLALNPSTGRTRDLLIEGRDYQAVHNKAFVYAEHNTGERELYDLRRGTANYDPFQLQSRHADPAYNRIRAQRAIKLNQLRTCSGASCAPP